MARHTKILLENLIEAERRYLIESGWEVEGNLWKNKKGLVFQHSVVVLVQR